MKEYYQDHKYCPDCGCADIEQTCMSPLKNNKGEIVEDRNKARCVKCNWNGIVDDLVGEATKEYPYKTQKTLLGIPIELTLDKQVATLNPIKHGDFNEVYSKNIFKRPIVGEK